MLVSLKEVSKYVDIKDIDPNQIAQRLTDAGIEVEEVLPISTATNLVIGEVIYCENMPESDHLHLTKVNIGSEILDIVCGAPNVRKGLKVIVAQVGANLPGNIKIGKGKIKGYESNGMLCSLKELGVDDKYLKEEQINGIEELPSDAIVGNTKVLEYLGLDDVVLNLKLLANRSDCMSLLNVAKEISALFKVNLHLPETTEIETYKENKFKTGSNTEYCKAFDAKIFKDITIKESPKWLQDVLRSEGIRSINNIVDIGNYVMLLTGNPVHMYDLDKLPKNELIVRDDLDTKVVALDDNEYEIKPGDLVVTSNGTPVCIAGVMGLDSVRVDENSKNIALEVAYFNGVKVRKTSTRLGLSSDSSARFIKGIDRNSFDLTFSLITKLVKELASPKEISSLIRYDELDHSLKEITCSISYINNRLGSNLSKEEILDTLKTLHFKVSEIDNDNFKVVVPSYRNDVEGKADLSEEVVRYLGFDIIKDQLPLMETTVGGRYLEENKTLAIKDYLSSQGIHEILTYTLVSDKDKEVFNILNKDEAYVIKNPLTEDHKIVRTSLLPSLLNAITYNLNHQNKHFALFEVSNIESRNVNSEHLAIGLVNKKANQEDYKAQNYDFYDIKGYLLNILKLLNITTSRLKLVPYKESEELHPGRSALVYIDNKLIGVMGEIHPSIKTRYAIKKDVVIVGEFILSHLVNLKTGNNKFKDLSRFPTVSRDYAFFIDENSPSYSDITKEIKRQSSLIKSIRLFDLYSDDASSSVALSVTFEKYDASFTNDEVAAIDNKIRDILTNKLKLRMK